MAAALTAPVVSGCSAVEDVVDEEPVSAYDCDDVAAEAVRISGEQGAAVELLKVRSPRMVTDNRDTYSLPSGDDETLVLTCEGKGVWSDDSDAVVVLEVTVDSDGDTWVAYEAK